MVQSIKDQERDREDRIERCAFHNHGCNRDVLLRMLLAEDVDYLSALREQAESDEDGDDDVEGEREGEVGE